MSAYALAKELSCAGLRPVQHGARTWRAVCPLCFTPDDPARRPLGVWEWADGSEHVACWNMDCAANHTGLEASAYPGCSGLVDAPLWLAIVDAIGVEGLRRAWGIRRAAQISEAIGVEPPRIRVPR